MVVGNEEKRYRIADLLVVSDDRDQSEEPLQDAGGDAFGLHPPVAFEVVLGLRVSGSTR